MAESKAWLEHEATGLLGGIALAGSERIPVSVTDLKLDNCVLGWTMDVPRIGQPARFSVSLVDPNHAILPELDEGAAKELLLDREQYNKPSSAS